MTELAKRNIYSIRLPPQFEYDIICNNNCRIEVKSSRITCKGKWLFSNLRIKKNVRDGKYIRIITKKDRDCDFYVFVGYDKFLKTNYFIVPREIVNTRKTISIFPRKCFMDGKGKYHNSKYWSFLDKWDPILNFNKALPP